MTVEDIGTFHWFDDASVKFVVLRNFMNYSIFPTLQISLLA